MNICFLSDAIAEHTRRWVKYFALKGHNVTVLTLNPIVLDDYEPARVHVIPKAFTSNKLILRIGNLPVVLMHIRKIIRETRPDVLHAHSAGGYAWLAMASGFHPYIVTPWGTDILVDAKRSQLDRLMTTWALKRSDLITCDADHMLTEMADLGVNRDKMKLVIFGVDLRRFKSKNDGDEDLCKHYGLENKLIVISTRTLTPIHDVETSVHAFSLVKAEIPEAKFIIAADGVERNSLESLVDQLGIRESVLFVGYLTEDRMAMWLRVAHVYVSTSLTDAGLSGSTAEAMATELPVVVTDNGNNRDWIEKGKGGYLVPNKNYEMLAKHVIHLLRNKELRQEFGCHNRKIIEGRNNYVKEMDGMEKLYKKLAR